MFNLLFRSIRALLIWIALPGSILLGAIPGLAHEFWIEPEKFQANSHETVIADLRNGQMFDGPRLPYLTKRIHRFGWTQGEVLIPYVGRLGDIPAFRLENLSPGLLVVVHETRPELITYEDWQDFADFGVEKDLGALRRQHLSRNLPEQGFSERYSRHAKLLMAIGHGQGSDRQFGLEMEFVALQNPYDLADASEPALLPLRLFYQGQPRAASQVEVFERTPQGGVTRFLARTDAQGLVRVPMQSGHDYLLNAVVIRPLADDPTAVWETLWASISFAAP